MAEEKEQAASKKDSPQMVPLSALLASKDDAKKLGKQLAEAKNEASKLRTDLKVKSLSVDDDDEVTAVKKLLLDQEEEIAKARAELEERGASVNEREREAKVIKLKAEFKQQFDIDLDEGLLKAEDDMEAYAYKKVAEQLTEEKKTPQSDKPEILETGPTPTTQKSVKDMNRKDFAEYEKELKTKVGLA